MSEQVNQSLSLAGKIPSGAFNAMFDYRGCWHRDAAVTRSLCFDGRFVELYSVEAVRAQLALQDRVKQDLPPFWDPPALAEYAPRLHPSLLPAATMRGASKLMRSRSPLSLSVCLSAGSSTSTARTSSSG
jgi:hypothetical protein